MTNLIFLALSRLPYSKTGLIADISASYFNPGSKENADDIAGAEPTVEGAHSRGAASGEENEILYQGQMEPIVIWKAKQYSGDRLKVIVLCTRDVLCTDFSQKNPVTSAQFFMQNVCDQTGSTIDLGGYQKAFTKQKFTSDDNAVEYILIPVDEDHVNAGIADSVDEIRRWNAEADGEKGLFWIDAHGGFRSTMTIMAGILSLLKIDGIIPDSIYSSRYANGIMTLSDEEETFGVFDFVTGMNDFIHFGNADLLLTYFEKRGASAVEKSILACIDKIALGMQCCDTVSYKQGLKELSGILADPGLQLDSLLGIFLEYIRYSYGDLLDKKKQSTLMIVRRCVEKKLYQQALTFIEASMPEEIIKKELLVFPVRNYQLPEVVNNEDGDANYCLLDSFLKMGDIYPMRRRHTLKQTVNLYAGHENELRDGLRGKPVSMPEIDTFVNTADRNNVFPFDHHRTSRNYSLPATLYGINTKVPESDRDRLGVFLRMHQVLKKCRNAFNHSLQDRPDLSKLLTLLKLYMDYAEYLYRSV